MFLFALFDERIEIVEALEMDCRAIAPAYRSPKPLGVMGLLILCMMIFPSSADATERWLCEETAYYSIYEDVARLEGQTKQNAKILQWIDTNTIGLESATHKICPSKAAKHQLKLVLYLCSTHHWQPSM